MPYEHQSTATGHMDSSGTSIYLTKGSCLYDWKKCTFIMLLIFFVIVVSFALAGFGSYQNKTSVESRCFLDTAAVHWFAFALSFHLLTKTIRGVRSTLAHDPHFNLVKFDCPPSSSWPEARRDIHRTQCSPLFGAKDRRRSDLYTKGFRPI